LYRFALHNSHVRINTENAFNLPYPLSDRAFLLLVGAAKGCWMLDCTAQTCVFDLAELGLDGVCARHHVAESMATLRRAILEDHAARIAVVSSFGAESAVLLALVAEIDPATPVLFVDTEQHFAETLDYRDTLTKALGLRDVRTVSLTDQERSAQDPAGALWRFDPDACCRLRKVSPLDRALAPFDAWITGRKRHQALTRISLPVREKVGGKVKLNPLADWSAEDIEAEMERRGLPRHALSLSGYPSIGCAPCTRAVATGEDPRSGRWAGTGKTECGIHRLPESTDAD
jgi:phosphoadenosine phosphosulfate reductase